MKIKSRKQARKEFRKSKKIKKHEFFSRKKPKTKKNNSFREVKIPKESESFKHFQFTDNSETKKTSLIKEKKKQNFIKSAQERLEHERQKEKMELEKLDRDIKLNKINMLKSDNLKEDFEIKKLEKQLKMNKRPSKAFVLDGLDYILDVCDKKISENEYEKTFRDSDSEFENDLENIVAQPEHQGIKKNKNLKKKKLLKNKEIKKKLKIDSDSDIENEEFENSLIDGTDDDNSDDPEKIEFNNDNYEESFGDDYENNNYNNRDSTDNAYDVCNRQQEDRNEFGSESSDLEKKECKNLKKKNLKNKQKKKKMENENKEKLKFKKIQNNKETNKLLDDIDININQTKEVEFLENQTKCLKEQKLWEDIYGRTRDEEGNIIKSYVPPHLRNKIKVEETEKTSEKLFRLKKQIKGLLNRLAESNMNFISNQVELLYMSNSRNLMNETLFTLIEDSLFLEILTPERLIAEHAMLVAVLHSNIGSEIGAHFLQCSIKKFCEKLDSNPDVENKEINNFLIFILYLYNFQIFHSRLMYDLIYLLLKELKEKRIELLLVSLRIVGFNLRKDDPAALKNLVLEVQKEVSNISIPELSSRAKFMLDMLKAIKNNNMSKIPNYDPEFVEKLRKSLKLLIRKGNYSTELNISLNDLLNAEKQGRWWIVGSAWSGEAPGQSDSMTSKKVENLNFNEFSKKLLDLAKQQRMNTDIRRNIFCILMSAEDFLDAFEKLIKLKLKGAVEREIMTVLFHCALQEKNFNPYYVYLADKFCTFDRKYQIMLQCALWDRIKEFQSLLPVQITNLAKFVGNIILKRSLPISVLKVIQFSDLDKITIKFIRQVLLTILCHEDENSVIAVFKRIADSTKLKLFRESLRLFLQHFVLKNTKNIDKEKVSKLVDMVKVAEDALTSADIKMVF